MEHHEPGARPGFRRIDRASRWAGILLCWAHATAMALTVVEAMRDTATRWWAVSWVLVTTVFAAWALLRAMQKKQPRESACCEGGEAGPCLPEETNHYDRAA
ncbi:hypothetical protein ACFYX5_32695 [Streptomyces rubiginosohelvolus]|uniref:hypothetical protein n=1 Tax=Streptomyces rubiginosohelvolus TaxID=67362 RepID=UPI003681025D